ncbi:PREDICTED: survival of motor neuron-related-splicing factor 30-like [Acropora digitifera]|uniref:survival of motor neuron-related-splicing factor 30-like n=1 Tax=Acropora digitifera TaxID=70779 RepID=UPI00077ACBD9|nr:PREDICTED: survival of motor neuron-related-splicing factor 30-like [Acropora digitifera]
MADAKELQNNLTEYRAQFRQVEAALTTDPENEELKKLKQDLEEVITLTLDLLNVNEKGGNSAAVPSGTKWKVGDTCQAVWSQDGSYYDATVDSISDDLTTCTVSFDKYGNTEIVKLSSLRPKNQAGMKRPTETTQVAAGAVKKSRAAEDVIREQKKKKLLKKAKIQFEEVITLTLDLLNVNEKGGNSAAVSSGTKWKVGDTCQAVWSQDGSYYDATVDSISDDLTTCTVSFDKYGNTEIVKLSSLRQKNQAGMKRPTETTQVAAGAVKKSRAAEDVIREQKKKKLLKKKQRAKVRKQDNYYYKLKIRHNVIQLWFKLTQLEKNSSALDHS